MKASPPHRRVIVHADDFGLHPALNAGIEQAHRRGIVTSASIMPNGPAFDDAVRRCRALPALDLGLHFALVGVPGSPPDFAAFLRAYLRRQISPADIAEALRGQLDACLAQGLTPTHIDSHQHLHALPGIMRIVCRVAPEYGITAIRLPCDGPARATLSPSRRVQAAALRVMSQLSRPLLRASGLQTTDHFSGMAVSGHLTAPTLASYLTRAQPGTTEIVCHPGASNQTLSEAFHWGYDWEGELAVLCAPEVRQIAGEGGIRLGGWTMELDFDA